MGATKTYIAIDLKSFYASVECVERGLDPLTTNLVVADESRTEKTICLAVSPSLKAYGIPGRARLFEVIEKVGEINYSRKRKAPGNKLTGESYDDIALKADQTLAVGYVIAKPQMARYIAISTQIYKTYLKYVAEDDIHVYSIDEVFIDATAYLKLYGLTAHEFAMKMIRDVLCTTGITATAGIGTNLFLCKVAMDIVAKHIPPDKDGVRIAELDEASYRRQLWDHRPLTDFWRVGKGYAAKLEERGLYTMGDIARLSETHEDLLYDLFGVNAELLIDHAWGWEPCTIAEIKAYRPENNSICSGQVLQYPYPYEKARIIVYEMADALSLDLVEKHLVTDQLVLDIGYDTDTENADYTGEYKTDRYGRKVPKHAHGSESFDAFTSSTKQLTDAALRIFDSAVNKKLFVRRLTLTVCRVTDETEAKKMHAPKPKQLSFFDTGKTDELTQKTELEKERKCQETVLNIRKKYGKNAILKGIDYEDGATARDRNSQIGGHKA